MQESSLQKLLNDYGRRQVPSPSEELHWAGLVRRWLDYPGGPDAAPRSIQRAGRRSRDRLVEGNVRWVVAIAKKYCCSNYSDERLMEAIQSGVLGLIRAIERFDHTRGYKLSTFSYFWILQGIQRGEEHRLTIRLPDAVQFECRKIERAALALSEKGERPTQERLAEATKIPVHRVKSRLAVLPLRHLASLDSVHGDDHDSPLVDLIADPNQTLEADVERQAMTDWLDGQLAQLPERQRTAIAFMREGRDRKEAARQLGISTSAVALHQSKAINALRHRLQRCPNTLAA